MNPEMAITLAEEVPALVRVGAGLLEGEATNIGARGLGQFFVDLAGQFKGLRPLYPNAETLLNEPVQGLESRFFVSRDALAKSLDPAHKLLPQLGLHGTSLEGGAKMLANQSAHALDFATFPEDSALKGTTTYLSEVGRSTETAVSFSEKWAGFQGKHPGPVFVMDISAAKRFPINDVPIPNEYGGGDDLFLKSFFPEARQFKGTLYGLNPSKFPTIVSGTLDYNATRASTSLAELLNKNAMEQIAGGAQRDKVIADLWARGNVLSATRRLDLAHQSISQWLLKAS